MPLSYIIINYTLFPNCEVTPALQFAADLDSPVNIN